MHDKKSSMAMTATAFKMGDKVRSIKRPEWGEGSIIKLEAINFQGKADHQMYVRFATAGVKTLLASAADLIAANGASDDVMATIHRASTLSEVESKQEAGWLGSIERRRPEEVMTSLPPAATDPFLSLRKRLENTVALYRFDVPSGRLIEWAIAQSGVDDPMSRFNRNQLEGFFQRWKFELDAHFGRLLGEARRDAATLKVVLDLAPQGAKRAAQKLQALLK